MAKIVLEEQPDIPTLPADSIVELKVDEVNTREVDGRNGKWTKLEIKFKILGIQAVGDGSDPSQYDSLITTQIFGSVPFRLTDNPENKLRLWSEAILNTELGVGFELDTDMFKGRMCRAITSQYEAKAKDSHGVPFKRAQVESLLAPRGGSAPAPQQQYVPPVNAGAQDPWGTPAPQQAAPQQAAPSYTQPAAAGAPAADPWGSGWGDDEPPF